MSTISEVIIKDHRQLEQYYNKILASSDHDHQVRFGNQFTWELARHFVGEELVVFPAFEKYLDGKGHEMAEHDRSDHQLIKELLKSFQNMKPTDSNYVDRLQGLWAMLSQHIEDEEKNDLPALEDALTTVEKASSSIAKSFGRAKAFVPSRSHPIAGENPPFATAVGLLSAPIDRLTDIFRKFPD
ncbi:hypothetical protein NA57DRAFT_70108 [Rhizodiscina lignyota]|uniref:Hemerythrin-like domain-containing protein n=1 Tax=Rhizodiscina lignyota TaxID=1504668 RepID=A0A9P4IR83_9PEZI|nr:hypothetical protein NA57DRAFT_70108 [Rhizodiscina lignyota]